jgi:hypothetical protein
MYVRVCEQRKPFFWFWENKSWSVDGPNDTVFLKCFQILPNDNDHIQVIQIIPNDNALFLKEFIVFNWNSGHCIVCFFFKEIIQLIIWKNPIQMNKASII